MFFPRPFGRLHQIANNQIIWTTLFLRNLMRILLSLFVLTCFVSCGAGLDTVSTDIGNDNGAVTAPVPDPMPSLPAAIETIASSNAGEYFIISGGTVASKIRNTFNYGLDTYVAIRENTGSGFYKFLKLQKGVVDTTFGTNGSARFNGSGGALPTISMTNYWFKKCGENVYAIADSSSYTPRIYKGNPTATGFNFSEINIDYVALFGAAPDFYRETLCADNHIVFNFTSTTPSYDALVAINTSTDNVSTYVDVGRTETLQAHFMYSYAGKQYIKMYLDTREFSVDENNNDVNLGPRVSNSSLFSPVSVHYFSLDKIGSKYRFTAFNNTNTQIMRYADFTPAELHAKLTNNNFVYADFKAFTIPGAYKSYNKCFSPDGKYMAMTFFGVSGVSRVGYGLYDMTSGTPALWPDFNSNAVKALPSGAPYNDSIGWSIAGALCNSTMVYLPFLKSGKLVYDRYSFPN